MWTANAGDDTRHAPEPAGARAPSGARIAVGGDAIDVAVGSDGAWVTNGQRGTVTQIDAVSNRVLGPPVRTGEFPTALAIGANHVWVVNSGDGTVARVDPRENVVDRPADCRSGATRRTSRSASARSGSPTAATGR